VNSKLSIGCLLLGLASTGCNVGGRGGGPTGGPRPEPSTTVPQASTDPVVRGAVLYHDNGCVLCHAEAGKGGKKNTNSETGGEINGLTLVKEGYSEAELIDKIASGVDKVGKDDPEGVTPPYHMPHFGDWLTHQELSDIAAYLFSLYPADRAAAFDNWDEE